MNHWLSQMLGRMMILLAVIYVLGFAISYGYYLFHGLEFVVTADFSQLKALVGWVIVGVSLSLLTSLTAWPFALAAVTLLEHNKSRRLTSFSLRCVSYLASLPLVLFLFVYVQIVGEKGFLTLKAMWLLLFASPNVFTQALAFGLTLLMYPLTIIPGVGGEHTIDVFYNKMLDLVIECAELGLLAIVVVLGLFLYVFPKMILYMRQKMQEGEQLRSLEIIHSLGGTPWESMHLTVMQSMRTHFDGVMLYFTRRCFFEGLITYTLLSVFFSESVLGIHWSSTLPVVYIQSLLQGHEVPEISFGLCGILAFLYILFLVAESHLKRRGSFSHV